MPLRAAAPVVAEGLIVLYLFGCATSPTRMGKEELARLKDSEIQAVYYLTPVPGKWKWDREWSLVDLFTIPGPQLVWVPYAEGAEPLGVARAVRDRFVAQLEGKAGLKNVQLNDERLLDGQDRRWELRRLLGPVLVLDFKATGWEVITLESDKVPYYIPTTVRARLLRLSESAILWQATCSLRAEADLASARHPAVLRETVALAAEGCADELLAQFLGQNEAR